MAYFRSLVSGPTVGSPFNTYTYTLSANDGESASDFPGTSYAVDVLVNGEVVTRVAVGDATGGGDLPDGSATFDVTPGFAGSYVITFESSHAPELSFAFSTLTLVVSIPSPGRILLPGGLALIVGGKFCVSAAVCCCVPVTGCPPDILTCPLTMTMVVTGTSTAAGTYVLHRKDDAVGYQSTIVENGRYDVNLFCEDGVWKLQFSRTFSDAGGTFTSALGGPCPTMDATRYNKVIDNFGGSMEIISIT